MKRKKKKNNKKNNKKKLLKKSNKKNHTEKLKKKKLAEKIKKKKRIEKNRKKKLLEKIKKRKIAQKLKKKKQFEKLIQIKKLKKEKLEKRRLKKLETEKRRLLAIEEKILRLFDDLSEVGKKQGYVTIKQIERIIPKKLRTDKKIEEIKSKIASLEITIVNKKEEFLSDQDENSNLVDPSIGDKKSQVGKTNDPVRLYLRDMGGVDLLSREGEIAIAKRIEAGRELMIGAICESPLTIRSIINWRDSIKEGTMLLRDIVDLEATYDVSDFGENKIGDTLKILETNKKEEKNKEKNKENNNKKIK